MKLDLDEVTQLIRTEENPVTLQEKLKAMIEEAHPAPIFRVGDRMPMHEFLARYQERVCGGVVPIFYDRVVMVLSNDPDGLAVEIEHGSWAKKN